MFNWKPAYSVNISSIDAQHQTLLAMGRELLDAMSTRQGQAATGKILDRLIKYTATHFAYEEQLMQTNGYPAFAAHKSEHDALIAKVLQFQVDLKAGRAAISIQLLEFLKNWLVGHIQGSDRKYVPFIREKSVA
jgi:hemerythrin